MESVEASIVIEMMGRPPEHIESTLKEFVKRIDNEEGVEIVKMKTHKAKKIDQKDEKGKIIKTKEDKQMYSVFSEIDLKLESIFHLIRVVFGYMPSHIEITNPIDFKMENFDMSSILTEVTRKLHQYDAITKNALLQNKALLNQLNAIKEQTGATIIPESQMPTTGIKKEKSNKRKGKKN
jgi:hypothetical protein